MGRPFRLGDEQLVARPSQAVRVGGGFPNGLGRPCYGNKNPRQQHVVQFIGIANQWLRLQYDLIDGIGIEPA